MPMFMGAGDVDGVEPREWTDHPDESDRFDELKAKVDAGGPAGAGRISRRDAREYAELYARRCVRREFAALRRRVQGWTGPDELGLSCNDAYEAGAVVNVLREVVTVLDERVSAMGGHERGTE